MSCVRYIRLKLATRRNARAAVAMRANPSLHNVAKFAQANSALYVLKHGGWL